MYDARVYRIQIGAPSDIKDEILIASRVMNHWNNLHSEQSKLVLLPLHYSINSFPSTGAHPQKILNKQLVERSDMMLCIFGMRIGTHTDTEISGTVEEIQKHIEEGKQIMMFFRKQLDITKLDVSQWCKLQDFKKEKQNHVLWYEYENEHDFESVFYDKLCLFVNDYWLVDHYTVENDVNLTLDTLSDFDKKRLVQWSKGDGEVWINDTMDGRFIKIGETEYIIDDAKVKSEWNSFLDDMVSIGFSQVDRYNDEGKPVYILTLKGYKYIEQLV